MKKEKETKEEIDNEEIKEKKKKRKIILIVIGIILLSIIIYLFFNYKYSILITKKDKQTNNENINYLSNEYGSNIKVFFIAKKRKKKHNTWHYDICSKSTKLCVRVKYNEKKKTWEFPYGEGFLYTLLLIDDTTKILENNHIEYKIYTNNKYSFDLASKFILVLKKDNENDLINTIKEIDRNNLVNLICAYSNDSNCTGEFEINIFNREDYDLITKIKHNNYGIDGYYTLYEVLLKNDNNQYGNHLGSNIVRHRINDSMFSCNIDLCQKYKHIAYRYTFGNHNQFNNSIIIEGI